jgi:hypothetical protein
MKRENVGIFSHLFYAPKNIGLTLSPRTIVAKSYKFLQTGEEPGSRPGE